MLIDTLNGPLALVVSFFRCYLKSDHHSHFLAAKGVFFIYFLYGTLSLAE